MFGRGSLLLLGLGAAVGVPLVASKTTAVREQASEWWTSGDSANDVKSAASSTNGDVPAHERPQLRPEGANVSDLSEIFRFDVTAPWVLGRWPRVTTRLAELNLQGYRVPLVTGTAQDDLAGSLTYYFDKSQKVERITFRGTTGDSKKLVALLATKHGFVRQLDDDPGLFLYQVKWNGKAHSELHIRPRPVVDASEPYWRFDVALDMRRPHWRDEPASWFGGPGEADPRPAATTAEEATSSGWSWSPGSYISSWFGDSDAATDPTVYPTGVPAGAAPAFDPTTAGYGHNGATLPPVAP